MAKKGRTPSDIRHAPTTTGVRRPTRSESRPPSGERKIVGSESPARRRPTWALPQVLHAARNSGRESSRVYIARLLSRTLATAGVKPRARSSARFNTGFGECLPCRISTRPATAPKRPSAGASASGAPGSRQIVSARTRETSPWVSSVAPRRSNLPSCGAGESAGSLHPRTSAGASSRRLAAKIQRHPRAAVRIPPIGGNERADERRAVRDGGGAGDGLHGPCDEQDLDAPRECGDDRRHYEECKPDQEEPPSAVAIAQRAPQWLDGGHGDQVGGHDPGAPSEGAAEVLQKRGDGHGDHGRVERGEHRAQRYRGEHHALGQPPFGGACLHARISRAQLSFSERTRTMPASPSTSTACPLFIVAVADPVPTTAGMRYSRATTAQWLRMPPVSVTTAAAVAKSGVHGGGGGSATRTPSFPGPAALERDRSTLARPRTTPGEPGLPRRTPGSPEGWGGPPKNLPIARFTELSGGGPGCGVPKAGGGCILPNRSSSSLRWATRTFLSRFWSCFAVSCTSSRVRWKTSSGLSMTPAWAKRRPNSIMTLRTLAVELKS